jgi:uncharacterized protein (TIGR01777 family)
MQVVMKFFFTGGTGFIGSILCKALTKEGHEITMLTNPMKSGGPFHKRVTFVEGDPTRPGDWQERVAEHDVVVNLAGASLFQRWNSKVKKEIFDSRVLATTNIVEALKNNKGKAAHLFSASGVGYYGYHGDKILDEDSPPGNSFLARVALEWEAVARKAEKFNIRVILCRFGIVLGGGGGALRKILQLSNLHIGGRWGGGNQWFSWIHERDVVNIFLFLLAHTHIEGPVNFTAPTPVQNKEMAKLLEEIAQRRLVIGTIPAFIFRLVWGEFSNVFLQGQRVFPHKLIESGFSFQFQTLRESLIELTGK